MKFLCWVVSCKVQGWYNYTFDHCAEGRAYFVGGTLAWVSTFLVLFD